MRFLIDWSFSFVPHGSRGQQEAKDNTIVNDFNIFTLVNNTIC